MKQQYVVICLREQECPDTSAGHIGCCASYRSRFVHGVYGPFTTQREAKRQIKSMRCDGRIHQLIDCDLHFYALPPAMFHEKADGR